MKISKLIGILGDVMEDHGDSEIGIRAMDDDAQIIIEPIAGISANDFEGINLSTFED